MREYKDLSELVIRVMNKYSFLHNKQLEFGDGNTISFSEAQIIEEILRSKDSNMTTLAKELGVTKAAVTKTMKKLEAKGFIDRYKLSSNKKDIYMSVTDLGNRIYQNYQNFIYENLFQEIFEILDQSDEKSYSMITHFFRSADKSLQKVSDKKIPK